MLFLVLSLISKQLIPFDKVRVKVKGAILHLNQQECYAEPVEAANTLTPRQTQGDKKQPTKRISHGLAERRIPA